MPPFSHLLGGTAWGLYSVHQQHLAQIRQHAPVGHSIVKLPFSTTKTTAFCFNIIGGRVSPGQTTIEGGHLFGAIDMQLRGVGALPLAQLLLKGHRRICSGATGLDQPERLGEATNSCCRVFAARFHCRSNGHGRAAAGAVSAVDQHSTLFHAALHERHTLAQMGG